MINYLDCGFLIDNHLNLGCGRILVLLFLFSELSILHNVCLLKIEELVFSGTVKLEMIPGRLVRSSALLSFA